MLLQVRLDSLGHLVGRGRSVWGQRHRADSDDRLDHAVIVERYMSTGKARGNRRMCVNDSADIGSVIIALHVHLYLGARAPVGRGRLDYIEITVDQPDVIPGDLVLGYACPRGKEAVLADLHGNVAVIGSHPALLPHLMADLNYLVLDFLVHIILPFYFLWAQTTPFCSITLA